jgi:hypothetical protein
MAYGFSSGLSQLGFSTKSVHAPTLSLYVLLIHPN